MARYRIRPLHNTRLGAMTLTQRVQKLGYVLTRNQRSSIDGRTYPYRTSPGHQPDRIVIGGPTLYHNSRADVERWVKQVEKVREWQK